jgi:hypothetical protein
MHDDLVVLSGMSPGAERLGASIAVDLGVPLVAVLAYPGVRAPDAAERIELQGTMPQTKQQFAAAFKRRDAWLARHAHEAVLAWDGKDELVGRLVRSFRDHLGEEEVWVVGP